MHVEEAMLDRRCCSLVAVEWRRPSWAEVKNEQWIEVMAESVMVSCHVSVGPCLCLPSSARSRRLRWPTLQRQSSLPTSSSHKQPKRQTQAPQNEPFDRSSSSAGGHGHVTFVAGEPAPWHASTRMICVVDWDVAGWEATWTNVLAAKLRESTQGLCVDVVARASRGRLSLRNGDASEEVQSRNASMDAEQPAPNPSSNPTKPRQCHRCARGSGGPYIFRVPIQIDTVGMELGQSLCSVFVGIGRDVWTRTIDDGLWLPRRCVHHEEEALFGCRELGNVVVGVGAASMLKNAAIPFVAGASLSTWRPIILEQWADHFIFVGRGEAGCGADEVGRGRHLCCDTCREARRIGRMRGDDKDKGTPRGVLGVVSLSLRAARPRSAQDIDEAAMIRNCCR